ncbi:hypothetical protein [Rhodomicrobium sp. R_RK_3]|nr:hypothetical protein [Rhodomicrobium sp. R_RK_3]
MPSPPSSITAITTDYDAIERAIRETSRGRWFLACYLERNRSAETNMLLAAIGKLESAMRESGKVVDDGSPLDTLATLREAIGQARSDMAQMPGVSGEVTALPVRRFSFETIPAALGEETRVIRDAAASIHSAAYALQAAGVFQGVARQIRERAEEIERACGAQETVVIRAERMSALLSEIEAELMSVFDDRDDARNSEYYSGEIRDFVRSRDFERPIPDGVAEEISAALSIDEGDYRGPSRSV